MPVKIRLTLTFAGTLTVGRSGLRNRPWGGLSAIAQKNREKAQLLYGAIDARPDLYRCPVDKDSRSTMNVVFTLPNAELESEFISGAQKQGMVGLKGHRSVGGVRISIYNAAEPDWVKALVSFMNDFHKGA